MTTPIDALNGLNEQVQRMQEQMRETAQLMVKDGCKAIFDEYGDILHSFGWEQYTPYFNDGDPCEFGMHELILIAKEDISDARAENEHLADEDDDTVISEQDWLYDSGSPAFSYYESKRAKTVGYGERKRPNPNYEERYGDCYEACSSIYTALAANGQQLAKDVFGDHVRVIFTPAGVDVEQVSHD